MIEKMSRDALIHQLGQDRAWIEAMIDRLDEGQMNITGVQGNWSVKDIIAHLTTWERHGTQWLAWVNAVEPGDEAHVRQAGYSSGDVDRMNLDIYNANKHRPLSAVLADFEGSFPPLLEQIQMLQESDLERVFLADWTGNNPATVREVVSWRFYHYRAHGNAIEQWLNRLEQR